MAIEKRTINGVEVEWDTALGGPLTRLEAAPDAFTPTKENTPPAAWPDLPPARESETRAVPVASSPNTIDFARVAPIPDAEAPLSETPAV